MTAACMLLPATALAQPKKKPGRPPAQPTTQPAQPPANAAGGGDIELDAPQQGAAAPEAAAPGAEPGAAPAGGICEIDPSACPKAEDIKAAAAKKLHAEVYAVEQIYALRNHRFELQPYWSFSLNDQFVSHPGPGLGLNFYITNVLAVGVNGTYYGGLNVDSDFNFQNRRAARIGVPINEYQATANLNFTYVPIYGKFAGFSEFIFQYDAYIVGGVGILRDRPIPVIDPDNRKFDWNTNLDFNVGLGLRIFLTRWLAATAEIRNYIFSEKLENLVVPTTPQAQQDPGNWYGEKRITVDVQAQLGISIFLPFSWEYRLPK